MRFTISNEPDSLGLSLSFGQALTPDPLSRSFGRGGKKNEIRSFTGDGRNIEEWGAGRSAVSYFTPAFNESEKWGYVMRIPT